MSAPRDNAGLVYMLDAAGRTIAGLEERIDALTAELVRLRTASDTPQMPHHDTTATQDQGQPPTPPTGAAP